MKKELVEKIEEEIKQKTTLPDEIKGKIRKEIFINVVIAIVLVAYFTFLILGSVGTIKNVRSIDFNIFSMLMLGVAIYLFEISYRKDNGKLAIFGIEALITAIFTLFLPYIIFELDEIHKRYYLMISVYVGIYYIIKCICIFIKMKKEHMEQVNDIKEIIKKEKRKIHKDIKDDIEKTEEVVEAINDKEVNKPKKDKEEIKHNNKKTVNTKTKSATKKVVNNKEKNTSVKESTSKKKTNKTEVNNEKNSETNNTTKKRGRPKKEETIKKEMDSKSESAPKKRGRPKKEETIKKEANNNNVESAAPKKRGRPRKVVIGND